MTQPNFLLALAGVITMDRPMVLMEPTSRMIWLSVTTVMMTRTGMKIQWLFSCCVYLFTNIYYHQYLFIVKLLVSVNLFSKNCILTSICMYFRFNRTRVLARDICHHVHKVHCTDVHPGEGPQPGSLRAAPTTSSADRSCRP